MRQISDPPPTPLKVFALTLGILFGMLIVGSAVAGGVLLLNGIDPLGFGAGELPPHARQGLRIGLLLNNLLTFGGTGFLVFLIAYRKFWKSAAGLNAPADKKALPFVIAAFVLAFPFIAYAAWLNIQLPLPDWMVQNEVQTNTLLKSVLTMSSIPEFLMALLTVAVTPAIGEELLLRGVVQRRILYRVFKNHHFAIWVAAIVFSAMHMEFAGFMPRMLLGVLLGYAYYWTNSLWVPVVLHFFFNGMQVLVTYFNGQYVPDTEITDVPPWYLALASLLVVVALAVYIQRRFSPDDHVDPLRAATEEPTVP
jgi:membrane protease YdiL (CAAX protease family)